MISTNVNLIIEESVSSGLALRDKTVVVNRAGNYAKLVEFNYFDLIYYKVKHSLLQIGIGILKKGIY